MNKTAEQLDQEADELWKAHFAPDDEINGNADDASKDSADAPVEDRPSQEPQQEPGDEPATRTSSDDDPRATADSIDDLDGLSLQNAEERIRNAQARMHAATAEAGTLRKEVGQLRADNQRLSADVQMLQQEAAQLRQAPPPKAVDSAPSSIDDGDLKSAMEEWPEVVNPLLKRNQQLEARLQALEGRVTKTVASSQEAEERAKAEAHSQAILARHPDAFEVAGTDDFQGWVARQPNVVRLAVAQGTSDDVVWVLDQYKQAVGMSNRLEQAREAATPSTPRARKQPTVTTPRFTRAQIQAMSEDEFLRNEAEIDKALASGLVY